MTTPKCRSFLRSLLIVCVSVGSAFADAQITFPGSNPNPPNINGGVGGGVHNFPNVGERGQNFPPNVGVGGGGGIQNFQPNVGGVNGGVVANPNTAPIIFPRGAEADEIPCNTYDNRQGDCRPLVKCATFYAHIAELSRSPCTISPTQQGVCCPPSFKQTAPTSDVLNNVPKKNVAGPVMQKPEVDQACQNGKNVLMNKIRFEDDLAQRNIVAKQDTAAFMHSRLFETTNEIINKGKDGCLALEASRELIKKFNLNKEQTKHSLSKLGVENTVIKDACPPEPVCPPTKYRSYDGSCNNLKNKKWGQAGTPFERFLVADYGDGLETPRLSVQGTPLPSARLISSRLIGNRENPYTELTMMIMQWGQFLDHDITHTPLSKGSGKTDISCCQNGKLRPSGDLNPECLHIDVPSNDPFYSPHGVTCMEFVRSMCAVRPNCKFGPREQMNQITAFIDGSNVYGSDGATVRKLRSFVRGEMKVTNNKGSHLLPGDQSPKAQGCNFNAPSNNQFCFEAGDSRVNEQPNLAVMHTVWLRQHNRVAQELAAINPTWGDDILFQEARRIIGAQMQHITYNEYLPIVLGRTFVEKFGLTPLKKGFSKTYKDTVNPTINNAFATAAFRYGHTLISSFMHGYGKFGSQKLNLPLSRQQFNPFSLYVTGNYDNLIRGLVTQKSEKFDNLFTEEITEKLFSNGRPTGMDLVALNIQRGRDHGLPSYPQWRDLCKLSPIRSFADLNNVMDPAIAASFQTLYSSVDDIDLFIGAINEHPNAGSLLGDTFLCLVGDQFARLKLGDRFFYDNGGLASSFSEAQLNEIRKTSLARILCDNSDNIETMQPLAFISPTFSNKRSVCSSEILIPRPRFHPWKNEPVFAK